MHKNGRGLKREPYMEMYEAIIALDSLDECVRFFDDLCTVTELRAIEQRYQVARLLSEGHVYSTILEQTGASSATISRVNRSLHYGKGGYEAVFNRMDENIEKMKIENGE